MKLPWARRIHSHSDPELPKYWVCAGCGHLILDRQVRNKQVKIINRQEGWEQSVTYGESCAPPWDLKEIGISGIVRYYKQGEECKYEELHSSKEEIR